MVQSNICMDQSNSCMGQSNICMGQSNICMVQSNICIVQSKICMGKSKNNALTRRGHTDVGIILQTINGSASHQQRKHRMGTKFMSTYTSQISKRVNQMIIRVSLMSVQISEMLMYVHQRCSARSIIRKTGLLSWVMVHDVYLPSPLCVRRNSISAASGLLFPLPADILPLEPLLLPLAS